MTTVRNDNSGSFVLTILVILLPRPIILILVIIIVVVTVIVRRSWLQPRRVGTPGLDVRVAQAGITAGRDVVHDALESPATPPHIYRCDMAMAVSLHIYSEKWREDEGGKRWKAREEAHESCVSFERF